MRGRATPPHPGIYRVPPLPRAKSPLQVDMRRSKMSSLKLHIVLYYHRTICNTEKL